MGVEDHRGPGVGHARLTDARREQLGAWMKAHERRMQHALERLTIVEQEKLRAALPSLRRLADLLSDPGESERRPPAGEE